MACQESDVLYQYLTENHPLSPRTPSDRLGKNEWSLLCAPHRRPRRRLSVGWAIDIENDHGNVGDFLPEIINEPTINNELKNNWGNVNLDENLSVLPAIPLISVVCDEQILHENITTPTKQNKLHSPASRCKDVISCDLTSRFSTNSTFIGTEGRSCSSFRSYISEGRLSDISDIHCEKRYSIFESNYSNSDSSIDCPPPPSSFNLLSNHENSAKIFNYEETKENQSPEELVDQAARILLRKRNRVYSIDLSPSIGTLSKSFQKTLRIFSPKANQDRIGDTI